MPALWLILVFLTGGFVNAGSCDSLLDFDDELVRVGFALRTEVVSVDYIAGAVGDYQTEVDFEPGATNAGEQGNMLTVVLAIGITFLVTGLAATGIFFIILHRKKVAQAEKEALSKSLIAPEKSLPTVRIVNVDNPSQRWEVVLTGSIIFGRSKNSHVQLDDKSVSRQQCKISYDGMPVLVNLSDSNRTELNGAVLNAPTIVYTGDLIKCGFITLRIDKMLNIKSDSIHKSTVYINV